MLERRGAAVEDHVDAAVEHRQPAAGGSHQPGLHVLGGLLEHLLRRSVPDAIGADRSDRHEGGVGVAVEGRALAMAPAEARPGGAPRVVEHDDVEVGVHAPERRDDQPAQRARADHDRGVAATGPAQDRVEGRGRGLGEDASLVGDAVGGDEHVLVDEEALAPATARLLARTDRPAGAERPAAVGVLAEVGLAGAAATALGEALVGAAQGRLDQDAVALVSPARRRGALHDADDLVAGNERAGGGVGGEHVGHRVAMDEGEIGAADPGQRGADEHPSGTGRDRGPDVAHLDGKRGARLRAATPATTPAAGAGVDAGSGRRLAPASGVPKGEMAANKRGSELSHRLKL